MADAPERVVSINLCTDQLAMMLAAPGQLVSVSYISTDPFSSPLADEAAAYHLNSGRAEAVFGLAPDLVLAGEYSDPTTIALLSDLGVRVEVFPNVDRLSGIPGALRRMGAALGRSDAAEALARDVEARLADDAPVAAFFYANGYTLGPGTLSHDIVRTAGFDNLSERLGMAGGGRVSLEAMLLNAPDLLITGLAYDGASRAEAIMAHPALSGLPKVVTGPEWTCGTPFTLDALDTMRAARRSLGD